MFRRLLLVQWWHKLVLFAVPGAAFALGGYLRFYNNYFSHPTIDYLSYAAMIIVTTVLWSITAEHFRLTPLPMQVDYQVLPTLQASAVTTALLLVLAFFSHFPFSRLFVGFSCVLMLLLTLLVRYAFLQVLRWTDLIDEQLRIGVIGVDKFAAGIVRKILDNAPLNSRIAAFVALPGQDAHSPLPDVPVVAWGALNEAAEEYRCQELVLAVAPSRFDDLPGLLAELDNICVPVRLALDIGLGPLVRESIKEFGGIPVVDVKPYAVDTLKYLVAKRAFDIGFSLAALAIMGPIMLAIAALIKITSPGPALFAQERIGLNGKRFKMLKFRSMVVQRDGASDSQHTKVGDPRITRLGQFLRRTSLDELPQFLNVLKGDMSVVGPRPELTHFVQKFRGEIPAYMARHNVKCGITGWAQINGLRGSHTSIPERIKFDTHYLQNWNMLLDLKIIVRTVVTGFSNKNAV